MVAIIIVNHFGSSIQASPNIAEVSMRSNRGSSVARFQLALAKIAEARAEFHLASLSPNNWRCLGQEARASTQSSTTNHGSSAAGSSAAGSSAAMHSALVRVQLAVATLAEAKAEAKAAKAALKRAENVAAYLLKTRLRQCRRCGNVDQCRPTRDLVPWFCNDPTSWKCQKTCYPAGLWWQLWDVFALRDDPDDCAFLQKVLVKPSLGSSICSFL